MKVCVVIPSYKAQSTLAGVIDSLPDAIAQTGHVVIVHDASPDNTGKVADELAEKHAHVTAVHHETNRGYGGALKTGLSRGLELGYDIFPIVHADGQYAPEMALALCEPIAAGRAQIVQGSRMLGGARKGDNPMPLSRYLPNKILTTLENFAFGTQMAEFHSGYMVYSRELLESVPFSKLQDNYNFDAEMIIVSQRAGYPCTELPIPTRYDEETSSLNPIPYGINVLKMIHREVVHKHYTKLVQAHQSCKVEHSAASAQAQS